MKETMKLVTVLFCITAVAAIILGVTNQYTSPIIEHNAMVKYQAALKEVYPEADEFKKVEEDYSEDHNIIEVQEAIKGGEVVGHVVKAVGNGGYGGDIVFVIGLDNDSKVVGFNVLSASETPGFGAKVTEPDYTAAVIGSENADDIHAISGATITSNAMARGYKAVWEAVGHLKGTVEKVDISDVRKQVVEEMFPGKTAQELDYTSDHILWAAKVDDTFLFQVKTKDGFGGPIEFFIGITDGKITNYSIHRHAESEGSGDTITKAEYKEALMGKTSPDEINAISEATITSDAMKSGFEAAFKAYESLK